MVRIEQCGQNLCGYAVPNGEKILVNMKPSDKKWTGRIHDPDSGSNYDSTIALKGPNTLKVQDLISYPYNDTFNFSTVAIQLGKELWVGSVRGDRVARFPLP